MKRLSEFHKNEIGYIHHIVYRSEAHRKQFFLQPLRGRSNLHIRQACPEISRSIVFSKNFHRNGIRFASVFGKGGDIGKVQFTRDIVVAEPGVKVTGYSDVRSRINPVCGESDFNYRVCGKMKVILRRSARYGIWIKHHNAVVGCAYTEFIFCAYHSERLDSPDFGLLDFEVFSKDSAYGCEQNFLTCSHIGCTAYDLQQFWTAGIHLSHVKMVGVRMFGTLHHLCHHHTCKAAGNFLNGLHRIHFKTYRGQCICHLSGGEVALKVVLQPVIRNCHIVVVLFIFRKSGICRKGIWRTPVHRRT